VSHVAPQQHATMSHVASSQGATLFEREEKEEIHEVSRREASDMRCPPIGLDLTHTPDLGRS
jgi:hypothetical protein